MIKRLQKINLVQLLLANAFFMLAFMKYNSFACEGGFIGDECVKHKDNFCFLAQIIINVLFFAFYLAVVDKTKWLMLALSLLLTLFIYTVAGFLHSFLQS